MEIVYILGMVEWYSHRLLQLIWLLIKATACIYMDTLASKPKRKNLDDTSCGSWEEQFDPPCAVRG